MATRNPHLPLPLPLLLLLAQAPLATASALHPTRGNFSSDPPTGFIIAVVVIPVLFISVVGGMIYCAVKSRKKIRDSPVLYIDWDPVNRKWIYIQSTTGNGGMHSSGGG